MLISEAKRILSREGFTVLKEKSKFDGIPVVTFDEIKENLKNLASNVYENQAKAEKAKEMLSKINRYTNKRYGVFRKLFNRLSELKKNKVLKDGEYLFKDFAKDYADLMDIQESRFYAYKQSTEKLLGTIIDFKKSVVSQDTSKDRAKRALEKLKDDSFLQAHENLSPLAAQINSLMEQWNAAVEKCEQIVDNEQEIMVRTPYYGYERDEEGNVRQVKESVRVDEGIGDFIRGIGGKIVSAVKKLLGLTDETLEAAEEFNNALEEATEANNKIAEVLESAI